MAQIIFNIENGKIERIKAALKGLYPILKVNTGTEEEPIMEPEFTDSQWAKEVTRRWIRDQVARWEQKTAKDAIKFNPEDDIIT